MTMQEVLKVAADVILKNDEVAILALADMMEQVGGMDEECAKVRQWVYRPPLFERARFEVSAPNGDKYSVLANLKEMVLGVVRFVTVDSERCLKPTSAYPK